jgi:hypothetical protein
MSLAVSQIKRRMDRPIPICVSVRNWLLSTSRLLVRLNIEFDKEQKIAGE